MKNITIQLFFFTISLFLSNSSTAQELGFLPGFIVTNSNDTIIGLVKNKSIAPYRILQEIKFKKTNDSKVEKFSPEDLLGFHAGSNRYISKTYKDATYGNNGKIRKSFMEIIVDGYLNFYELRVTMLGIGNEIIYKILERTGEGELFSVYGPAFHDKFKDRILEFLKDEPSICEKIKNGKYGKNDIEEIVKEYNLLKFNSKTTNYGGKLSSVVFYKLFKEKSANMVLSINDSTEYRLSEFEKDILIIKIPTNGKTKVCFGVSNSRKCELISSLPMSKTTDYYELKANQSKSKFEIFKRSTNEAQLAINQNRINKTN